MSAVIHIVNTHNKLKKVLMRKAEDICDAKEIILCALLNNTELDCRFNMCIQDASTDENAVKYKQYL